MSGQSPYANLNAASINGRAIDSYVSRRENSTKIRISQSWFIAIAGIVLGVVVTQTGARIDGAAIAVLGFAPLMRALERKCFPGLLIGPFSFMFLYHALGYGLGLMWQLHIIGKLNGIEEYLIPAQWGSVLGLITIAVVFPIMFRWSESRLAPKDNNHISRIRELNWETYALLLILVVGFSLGYGFFTGAANRLGGLQGTSLRSSSLVSALNPLQYPLFFFLGHLAARYRGKWIVIWLVGYIAYSSFFLLDGGRQTSALAALSSGVGWVWGGTSTRKVLFVGLLTLIGFVPLAGIILNYRNNVQGMGTQLGPRVEALIDAVRDFGQFQGRSLADSTEAFVRGVTVFSVDRVFLVMSSGVPFVGLEGIENVLYAFTPQIINPNRPELLDGNRLVIMYGGAPPGSTGSYMPTVGDGYRRGGWAGVVLLYAWNTLIFAVIMGICWTRRDQPEWMGIFIFLIFQAAHVWSTTMLSSFYLLLWGIPRSLIVFVVLGWIGRRLTEVSNKMN